LSPSALRLPSWDPKEDRIYVLDDVACDFQKASFVF
jgi:hypothetical protein